MSSIDDFTDAAAPPTYQRAVDIHSTGPSRSPMDRRMEQYKQFQVCIVLGGQHFIT